MKDIDFDELDRAVGSVLQGNPDYAAVQQKAESDDPAPTSGVDVATAPQPAATLVQKRSSGRFMDVVHPSSDMKMQRQARPVVSRTAPSVAPVVSDNAAPLPSTSEENLFPAEAPVHHETTDAPEAYAQPDPLDFHNFSLDADKTEVSPQKEASTSAVDDETAKDDADDEHELALERAMSELHELDSIMKDEREMPPLDTPFVGDLAVEKRPLGAFSIGSSAEDSTPSATDEEIETPSAEVAEETEPVVTLEETAESPVDEQAVAVEAPEETTPPVETPQESDSSTEEKSSLPEELESDIIAIESRAIESPAPAVGIGSIPQQYKESTTTKSTETTPVFDTAEYHQPLKHVEKKKSGWLRVVVIILLIALGIGAGAAIYYFDLLRFLG